MNYAELTPGSQGRYDGYMDPSTPERGRSEPTPEQLHPEQFDGLIAPVSEAVKSLRDNADKSSETQNAPANEMSAMQVLTRKKDEAKRTPLTRDKLTEYAETLQYSATPQDVVIAAEFVATAADVLQQKLTPKSGQPESEDAVRILKELTEKNVFGRAQGLYDEIVNGGGGLPGEDKGAKGKRALGRAGSVARLAKEVAGYFESAKLTLEQDDPFKQVGSFEELMGKFNKTQLLPQFRPGGEFSLIDVEQYVDEYGRTLGKETAHPENFLRWARERAWFYHDFDPMAKIDLFKGMYIVVGSRQVTMYEMLVDFDIYFSHRESTLGELKVLQEDYLRASSKGEFVYDEKYGNKDTRDSATVIGYYINPDTKERTGAYVKNIPEYDEQRRQYVYAVFQEGKDKEGKPTGEDVPVEAVLANKESWNTRETEGFKTAQTEIMYELWLMTRNHNADIDYRQKGMPNEIPLKETLTELYADNIWTRTPNRILKMLNMPTTTHREDRIQVKKIKDGQEVLEWVKDPYNEMTQKMGGKLEHQGSSGKAFQRSLGAYYHIAEANAAFRGYTIENNKNPFFEILKGKEGQNGAEVFYKSLIRQVLEKDFGYKAGEYDPEVASKTDSAAVDLVSVLNSGDAGRIDRGDGTSRKRFDWEKADLVDMLTMDKKDFIDNAEKNKKNISREQLEQAIKDLREKYSNLKAKDPKAEGKLKQLDELFSGSTLDKKKDFLTLLESGKRGVDAKYSAEFLKENSDNQVGGLDSFAVAVFVQSFGKEYAEDANPFINIRYALDARDTVRKAMQDALVVTDKLDEFEAKWSDEWSYTFAFHSGISARNDMNGIGHDAWSKIINTEFYRLRQASGGNFPGNFDNLYGIHRLGTDMLQGLKVKEEGNNEYNKTFYEEITGLEGGEFNINKDMKNYDFAGNSMRQFFADHVMHVIDLFVDITQKHEFNFDKIVSEDALGRVIVNHTEMQKMIDSTWKHMRYGFDNNSFLYDNTLYGWWYDESLNKDGQVKRNPHFGFKTLRSLMFSEQVQAMRMYERKDVSGWAADQYKTKMGRNVFAYLISAQLKEHTQLKGGATLYSADQIAMLTDAMINYASRVMRGEEGEAIVLAGFFTPEEMTRILLYAHAILWKLYAKEYGEDAIGGFLAALLQGFSIIMKEIGAGITLKS